MSDKHLEDIFLEGEGIFQAIADIEGFELWDATTAALMDEHYVNDYSGMKLVPHAIEKRLNDSGYLTGENLEKIAAIIWLRFQANWEKYYAYAAAEYNPIDNYSMLEVEDTKVNTDVTTKQNSSVTTSGQRYGFNSVTPVDVDKSTVAGSQNDNTVNQAGSWDNNKSNRRLTRSGNIGVTTTAQMLQGDSDFWSNWDLLTSIFKDTDKVLTLSVY